MLLSYKMIVEHIKDFLTFCSFFSRWKWMQKGKISFKDVQRCSVVLPKKFHFSFPLFLLWSSMNKLFVFVLKIRQYVQRKKFFSASSWNLQRCFCSNKASRCGWKEKKFFHINWKKICFQYQEKSFPSATLERLKLFSLLVSFFCSFNNFFMSSILSLIVEKLIKCHPFQMKFLFKDIFLFIMAWGGFKVALLLIMQYNSKCFNGVKSRLVTLLLNVLVSN